MKRSTWIIAIVFLALAQFAHADSFDLTRVTVSFSSLFEGANAEATLIGPGTNIDAPMTFACGDTWCQPEGFAPGLLVSPNVSEDAVICCEVLKAAVGGTNFNLVDFVFDGLMINSLGSFTLPQPSADFAIFTGCVPAKMSGSITAQGTTAGGTFVQGIVLNPPTTTGTFCMTFDFENTGWFLDSGTFAATTTPEPGTLGLMGSGVLAIVGAILRKRALVKTS